MNCNTTHYRANSSSVPGDPTARKIPERFLLKVLKPLVSARVLRSIKGPNGGYQLAKTPATISMLEVIEAVDGPIRGQAPFSEDNTGALNTKLETICQQSADQVKVHLKKVTISDLVSGKKGAARGKDAKDSED